MNFLYACDDKFAWLMGISMLSLFRKNKNNKEITVYLLTDNVSEENKEKLLSIANEYQRKIEFIDVMDFNVPKSVYSTRWPKCVCARLFAGELLPDDVKKIIYLDSDVIVNDDLSELWNIDMKENTVMGVRDCISNAYKKNIGIGKDELYLNTGVLLLDLEKMRDMDIRKNINIFMKKYSKVVFFPDQDILNAVFCGKTDYLDVKYNVMSLFACYKYKEVLQIRKPYQYYSREEFVEAKKHPAIIHYTTCMFHLRPWFQNSNHPYKKAFLETVELSPWNDMELMESELSGKKKLIKKAFDIIPDRLLNFVIGIAHAYIRPWLFRLKYIVKRR